VKASLPKLILASASPRRAELLAQLKLDFVQIESAVDESPLAGESPSQYVFRLAQDKSRQVASCLAESLQPGLLLGADTCIDLEGEIVGKPRDREQAVDFLSRLAGREHKVYSAVNVLWQNHSNTLVNCSKVWMHAMTQADIQAYCDSGEPLDKAGAYAIQGLGAMFIQRIDGSYSGIMGLPLFETASLLRQAGLSIISTKKD